MERFKVAAWMFVLFVIYMAISGGTAFADHYDQCKGRGLAGIALIGCQQTADHELDRLIDLNPEKFSTKGIVNTFSTNAQAWATPLIRIATAIFWSLAVIELILTFSLMAVRGSDLNEFAVELLIRILILSFGAFLLSNHLIFYDVINGFRDSASFVLTGNAGNSVSVERLLKIPLEVAGRAFKAAESLSIITDLIQITMIWATAVIILWAMAIASVQLLLVLCEMYIVITVGLLSLGFFSLKITREYPMRFFGGVIGTGFKLLALELIIAAGLVMAESWSTMPIMHQAGPYMMMAVAALMYKEIAVRVPNYIQSLLTSSPGSGVSAQGAVTGGMAVAGAGVAVAAGGMGKGMSVIDAVKMAKEGGATGVGAITFKAAGNLLGASMDQLRQNNPHAQQMRQNRMATQSSETLKSPPATGGKETS